MLVVACDFFFDDVSGIFKTHIQTQEMGSGIPSHGISLLPGHAFVCSGPVGQPTWRSRVSATGHDLKHLIHHFVRLFREGRFMWWRAIMLKCTPWTISKQPSHQQCLKNSRPESLNYLIDTKCLRVLSLARTVYFSVSLVFFILCKVNIKCIQICFP